MRKKGKTTPIYERETQKQKVMSMTQSHKFMEPATPKNHQNWYFSTLSKPVLKK